MKIEYSTKPIGTGANYKGRLWVVKAYLEGQWIEFASRKSWGDAKALLERCYA